MLKNKRYQNKKILDAARDCPTCMVCGKHNDGTIVGAHFNGIYAPVFGRGMGVKPGDSVVAFVCHRCHSDLDGVREHDEDGTRHSLKFAIAILKSHDWLFRHRPEVFR